MSFHTLKYDLKETFRSNVKQGFRPGGLVKGVAASFGNFGDRVTNSNHRHDEDHEKAADAEREKEKESNRFQ